MMYEKGDSVIVRLPGGEYEGVVTEVLPNYGFREARETKYQVSGKQFVTITSARRMRPGKTWRA